MSGTTLDEKVDLLIKEMEGMKIALKGFNGNQGLIKVFEQHCKNDNEFRKDYYKFKRVCISVFFFILGSGGLGLGIIKLAGILS